MANLDENIAYYFSIFENFVINIHNIIKQNIPTSNNSSTLDNEFVEIIVFILIGAIICILYKFVKSLLLSDSTGSYIYNSYQVSDITEMIQRVRLLL